MQITIDLNKLKNEYGAFSERDVEVLEKVTGKPIAELTKMAEEAKGRDFTRAEIAAMSLEEYEESREAILEAAAQGRVKGDSDHTRTVVTDLGSENEETHTFTRDQIGRMSLEEYEENQDAILKAASEGRIK